MNKTYCGKCVYWRNGFGFVRWMKNGSEQPDIFVHYSNVESPHVFKRLCVGDLVSFKIATSPENDKGVVATEVRAITQDEYNALLKDGNE